jgi:pimeloyl-ACP methyl ester carboxylesterase
MSLTYEAYTRSSLKQPPRTDIIGTWRVEYLAFSLPENAHKDTTDRARWCFPEFQFLQVLCRADPAGGSRHPWWICRRWGTTSQLAPQLGMEDLADLLVSLDHKRWVWRKVSLMGLSLGSVLASTYAYKQPQAMHKLIVTGILVRPRKSWRMLLEESIKVLDEGRLDEFGQAVVLYLINHARLKETEVSDITRKLFHRQMRSFHENEQQRYRINANRLMEVESILGYPECETLVATGEFDSFTLPWENAQFAVRCPNAIFAVIKGADHVAQLEKRDESVDMFATLSCAATTYLP